MTQRAVLSGQMTDANYIDQVFEGKYRILKLLGKGGMGSVYLGRHETIGRKVAVKFLHSELAKQKEFLERFHREARAAVSIGHRNVIEVLDLGVSAENEPYLVMEYLEGESLAKLIRRCAPLSLAAACAVLDPTLRALSAAHKKGIIHRDLKPENIFLVNQGKDPPLIKLIDFGISKFVDSGEATRLTRTGSLIGSPSYMPPEQVQGKQQLDHRADLYAAGVIFYEMLTGKLPFNAAHSHALLLSIITEPFIPPKEAYPDFQDEAAPLIAALLSKNPDHRPASAEEVLDKWLKKLNGYSDRETHLSMLVTDITLENVAGGDVGESDVSGTSAAQPIVSSSPITLSAWASTLIHSKKWITISGIALGAILLTIGAVFAFSESTNGDETAERSAVLSAPEKSSPSGSSVAAKRPESVQISVTGLPKKAVVYVDELPVPRNPFQVAFSKRLLKIRVTAEGFDDYSTWVVPDRDQEVKALFGVASTGGTGAVKDTPKEDVDQAEATATSKPALGDASSRSAPKKQGNKLDTQGKKKQKTSKIKKRGNKIKYLGEFDE